jgi:hypothetical protein
MTTKRVARCSIYENRPKLCVEYPTADHYTPPQCTYSFVDGERFGECACDEGACCATPREQGMPGGAAIPEISGGLPCKYLVIREEEDEPVKIASAPCRSDVIKEALGL